MENPEALGFHQETMKEPRQQTETTENSTKTAGSVLHKTLHYFSTNRAFFCLYSSRNIISTKPYFQIEEITTNFSYKIQNPNLIFKSRKLLQISVTKFKIIDVILMCLEILLYKHNAVIKVPGIVKQTVNRK